ncbi:Protochlorophyllide-dependent translocon component 52, chloroplastic [Linum perenne]
MCPHRLAPLSEGRVDQWGRLQCHLSRLVFRWLWRM